MRPLEDEIIKYYTSREAENDEEEDAKNSFKKQNKRTTKR